MMLKEFASRLDCVTQQREGLLALCPAHADRRPSLSVKAGSRGLLVKCWAGCTLNEIVAAMGLTLSDLFFDSETPRHLRKPVLTKPRLDLNKTAFRLRLYGDLLHLRARAVLTAATGLDAATWDDDTLARAMNAVASAHIDLERAAVLDDVAYGLRCRLLKTEMPHAA